MHCRSLFAVLAVVLATGLGPASPALAEGARATTPAARDCSFESLSPADRSRYQSRYRRRVRVDGQAFADRWLHEQVCMTAEERKALRQARRPPDDGKNCRAVSRPVTSLDGSMTVGIGRKCD